MRCPMCRARQSNRPSETGGQMPAHERNYMEVDLFGDKPAPSDAEDTSAYLRISDLIAELQAIKAKHGDLLITQERNRGGVRFYPSAQNQYEYAVCLRYIKPREKRDRILYYSPINQALGEKVLSIR